MFKLNIKKKKFGDIIVLILFDKLFDPDFVNESHLFNEIANKLDKKGFRSILFQYYFDVDSNIRSRYKMFKKLIESNNNVAINITTDKEDQNEDYRKIIKETVKRVTGKHNPDSEKLNLLTEQILNDTLGE